MGSGIFRWAERFGIVGDRRIKNNPGYELRAPIARRPLSLARTWQARCARCIFLRVTVEYPTSSDRSDGASRCSATTNRASEADCPFPAQDAGLVRSGAGADEAAATSGGHLRRVAAFWL